MGYRNDPCRMVRRNVNMRDWLSGFLTALACTALAIGVVWFLGHIHSYGGGRLICLW